MRIVYDARVQATALRHAQHAVDLVLSGIVRRGFSRSEILCLVLAGHAREAVSHTCHRHHGI